MKEKMINVKNRMVDFWGGRPKKQKFIFIGGAVAIILAIVIVSVMASKPTMEPLYTNLTPSETGTIKENLDGRGITSEIAQNGTAILVPIEQVDTLKVELAAEGIPDSGSIDYSFFGQNAGIGMTDNEFNVLKLESMQTELANLIKGIDGVNDAKVMISLPQTGIFVSDVTEQASASIVLDTAAGYQFKDEQIKALYHLVSKSVPNLPTDNIVITNQYFEYFDLDNGNDLSTGKTITDQMAIKKEIERDIQRQVQSMLGTLMGGDKVVVSVTADVDFAQENREENLVTPVDEENMEGIAISAQRLTETYSGENANAAGVPQAEDPADTLAGTYVEGANGNGDYEKVEETINNEVNRIKKQIVESPFKVRDLGIQVMVEPPTANDEASLPEGRIDDIEQILSSIIRTSITKETENEPLTDEEIASKIAVSVQEFNGKVQFDSEEKKVVPLWVYIVGGLLVVALLIVLVLYLRARKRQTMEEEVMLEQEDMEVPDVAVEQETEGTMKRKQLEKLAKEKPEEFAKLLRTWLTQD